MFGFTGNSLKYFILYLSFIGTKECVRKSLRFTPDQRALLVWDSFRGHLTDGMKELLVRRNVDVAVIPGGLTPVLQPLGKCLNHPLQDQSQNTISGLDAERTIDIHAIRKEVGAEQRTRVAVGQ